MGVTARSGALIPVGCSVIMLTKKGIPPRISAVNACSRHLQTMNSSVVSTSQSGKIHKQIPVLTMLRQVIIIYYALSGDPQLTSECSKHLKL